MTATTVASTATKLCGPGNRDMLVIYNNDSQPIFLSFDGSCDSVADVNTGHTAGYLLTTSTGFPLAAGTWISLNNDSFRNVFTHEIWAISAAGGANVRLQGV